MTSLELNTNIVSKNDKMRGQSELPVTLFCLSTIDFFLLNPLNSQNHNFSRIRCAVDYMSYALPVSSRTFIFLLTCDHARLFQFV